MSDTHAALERNAKAAGLEIMGQVLSILHDRENVRPERLLALTAEDIEEFYDLFIARAIDNIEDRLME